MSWTVEGERFSIDDLDNSSFIDDVTGFDKINNYITNLEYSPLLEHVIHGFDSHTKLKQGPSYDAQPVIRKVSGSIGSKREFGLGKLSLIIEVKPYYGMLLLDKKQESNFCTFPYRSIELIVKEYVPPVPFKERVANVLDSISSKLRSSK